MAQNPFFKDNNNEQTLVEDLTIETIKSMGRDMYYIPRSKVNKDDLFGEDPTNVFRNAYEFEMYILSIDGFEGEGDVVSKFGIEVRDKVRLLISKKRFEQEVSVQDVSIERPREGDLIYFPLSGGIFEINFVEHENPFYQLGKLYTYALDCDLFTYSYEDFETGVSDIDKLESDRKDNAFEAYMDAAGAATGGSYLVGETIYQPSVVGSSGGGIINASGSGVVFDWNNATNRLLVGSTVGSVRVDAGEYLIGVSSGTARKIQYTGSTNISIEKDNSPDGIVGDNIEFDRQKMFEDIFDFTEIDPFSEGNL